LLLLLLLNDDRSLLVMMVHDRRNRLDLLYHWLGLCYYHRIPRLDLLTPRNITRCHTLTSDATANPSASTSKVTKYRHPTASPSDCRRTDPT
jgi:hypothetical protein